MSYPRHKAVPYAFNKTVISRLDGMKKMSSTYVTMVRRGERKNDRVLLEIIKTDHNWKKIQHERLKSML